MSLITSKDRQIDMVMAAILLSETMVNKSSDEEPTYVFFKTKYADLRNLTKRTLHALKETFKPSVPKPSPAQLYFYIELLESLVYVILDFCINETASANKLDISFPISKAEAKQTLILGNEML